uniref:Mytilin 3 n=1 Tax=Mytilus californianus TaxID=6549 RepID=A0A6B9XR55_MYTCA|nr:mytilin 3 [Mytilus californianus]
MKVAIILAIALVVILAVHEAESVSCALLCKAHCRARRCGYYVSVFYHGRCYCRCLRCASEHTMKLPENEGSSPSEMFPQMNDNENTGLFQDIQKGETEQGETDM